MSDDAAQTSSEPTNKFTPTVTMLVLLGVTVVYVVGLGLLSTHLAPCEGATTDAAWTTRYLGCRTINEFGDALAGAFAPLAFLWLAGAVFIQSRELAAQRKELGLARDEARQTREVLSQQAAESRAATAFIGEQTVILKAQQAQKEQEEADEEFDQMLNAFIEIHGGISVKIRYRYGSEEITSDSYRLCNTQSMLSSEVFFRTMLSICRQLNKENYSYGKYNIIEWFNREDFQIMIGELEKILLFVDRLTPAHRQRARALRLDEIHEELSRIHRDFSPPSTTAPS